MILAVVQARQTSTRLKNKIFAKINDIYILDWIIKRVSKSKQINKLIFAIPKNKKNAKLKKILKSRNIEFVEGDEKDVLSRFKIACTKYNPKSIVRICADNPFVCPVEIDRLIRFFNNKKNLDYAYNHIPKNNQYPDGIGAEIISRNALNKIFSKANSSDEKEHIFNYLNSNPKLFKSDTLNPKEHFLKKPFLKVDIDYIEQLKAFQKLRLNPNMKTKQILKKILTI